MEPALRFFLRARDGVMQACLKEAEHSVDMESQMLRPASFGIVNLSIFRRVHDFLMASKAAAKHAHLCIGQRDEPLTILGADVFVMMLASRLGKGCDI
jgi:hypothetical protein